MPLIHSPSKKDVGRNIETEISSGKPRKQAIAIALDIQRRAGGGKPKPEENEEETTKAVVTSLEICNSILYCLTKAELSEAQKEAGNYKKKHLRMHGMDISIENPAGSIRTGEGPNGPWAVKMPYDYGYIKGTSGADGDQLDVAIGPQGEESLDAHIINQRHPTTGKFDEHKIFLGFPSREEAIQAFKKGRKDDPEKVLGDVLTVPVCELKRWMKETNLKRKAILKALSYSAQNER